MDLALHRSGREMMVLAERQGMMVHVSEVPSGLVCNCICPGCGTRLIARKGQRNRSHFAHDGAVDGQPCPTGLETALHKFAKEVLARDRKLVLPALELDNGTDSWVGHPGGWFSFDTAALEQRLGDLVPDVIVRRGDPDLLVEFAVTHPCDAAKITKIKGADLSAIEIDLPRLFPGWSRKHLETAILAKAPRRWLHNPKLRDGEAVLEERRRERERAFAQRVATLSKDYDLAARIGLNAPRLRVPSRLAELGLAPAVGINVDGVGCFSVCPQEWQSAVILDAVRRAAPGTLPFISEYGALESVRRRGWLRREFSTLTKAEVAAIRAHGTAFARPEDAILSWVTALARTGVLRAQKFGWTVWTETLESVSETARESLRRRELPNLRLKQLKGFVANLLRDVPEQAVASFSFDHWVYQELPGRGYSVFQAVHSDELYDRLTRDLVKLLTRRLRAQKDLDLLGLPISSPHAALETR